MKKLIYLLILIFFFQACNKNSRDYCKEQNKSISNLYNLLDKSEIDINKTIILYNDILNKLLMLR